MTVAKDMANTIPELQGMDQAGWDRLVADLLPSIHPVDRDATRIWFSFWPLKLHRLVHEAQDLDEVVRDRRLVGRFRLSGQLDDSVEYFYGRHFRSAVKRALLERAAASTTAGSFDLKRSVLETAAAAARDEGVDAGLTLGVSLVGWMALRQLGREAIQSAWSDGTRRTGKIPPPGALKDKRAKPRKPGWLSFLKGADQDHRVTFDEARRDGFYTAIHGQDLSMASAGDRRDYTTLDPRRLEGPVPFECRSGSCGFCWVGVLGGAERLEPISDYEARRLRYFGYVADDAPAETHPPIRLACQAQCVGDVTIVVPPWNGALRGRT